MVNASDTGSHVSIGESQREFKRFPEDIQVSYRAIDIDNVAHKIDNLTLKAAQIKNVSQSGLFISSEKTYAVGTVLELNFKMAALNSENHVLAEVAWVSKKRGSKGMGLQLIKTSEKEFSTIVGNAKRGCWFATVEPDSED